MNGRPRRVKVPGTPLGDKLRTFAKAYAANGQRDRAEGLIQAASTVDAELAGTTTGLVDDPLVLALVAAVQAVTAAAERITEAAADLASAAATAGEARPTAAAPATTSDARTNGAAAPRGPRELRGPSTIFARGERRVLIAVAQHPDGVTREQLTVLTGYKRSSRDTYLQRLRARGAVDDADRIRVTPAGRAELGPDFKPLPTGLGLRAHWLATLPEGERRVLEVLLEAGGLTTREEVSERTGYRRSSRDTYIQRLRARQLVEIGDRGVLNPARALYE